MGNPTELLLCKIMKSKMASSNLTKQIVKSTSLSNFLKQHKHSFLFTKLRSHQSLIGETENVYL